MSEEQDAVIFKRLYQEQVQANTALLLRIDQLKKDNAILNDLIEALTLDLKEVRK